MLVVKLLEKHSAEGRGHRAEGRETDDVLRRSVDDNAWDEESDEVWRGPDRSGRYGRALGP